MDNLVLSPVPLNTLIDQIRAVVREELSEERSFDQTGQGKIVSEKELCEFLDVCGDTVKRYRKAGKIPFMQIGSVVRYDQDKVIAALSKENKKK